MLKVLVVDDEEDVLNAIIRLLTRSGYAAEGCTSRAEARRRLGQTAYKALLLDRTFPDGDGLDLCRELRARQDAIPVVLLSGRGEDQDIVEGLEAGADDYVVKPISWPVLQARMAAIMRRAGDADRLTAGPFALEPFARLLTVRSSDGRRHQAVLSPSELRLMESLARSPDQVVERNDLAEALWTGDDEITDNALDAVVRRVRLKLGTHATALVTVRGRGFVLRTRKGGARS